MSRIAGRRRSSNREIEKEAIALLVPDRQNEISPGGASRGVSRYDIRKIFRFVDPPPLIHIWI